VAHLDTLTNGAEFQRADCAPADTAGDGQLKVTDWVQAGRYAAGLDVWKLAGGPTDETPPAAARPVLTPQSARTLTLDSTNVVQGLTRTFSVRLQASGNENAVGFSLNYAPASLTFVSAAVGANSGSATLNVNTNLAATGKIGCVLALPTGLNFAAGVKEIAKVTFRASSTNSGALPVAFIDSPVVRAVSDSLASELTATYTAGTLTVNPPPALGVARSSSNVTLSWPTYAGDFQLQAVAKLGDAWSNTSPVVNSNGGVISTTFSATNQPRFFRLQHP
ncbi:MAG: hypothetical protein RL380_825, partial [Verrucomicrobiota bacterium]